VEIISEPNPQHLTYITDNDDELSKIRQLPDEGQPVEDRRRGRRPSPG
jgi:hypothetical protein